MLNAIMYDILRSLYYTSQNHYTSSFQRNSRDFRCMFSNKLLKGYSVNLNFVTCTSTSASRWNLRCYTRGQLFMKINILTCCTAERATDIRVYICDSSRNAYDRPSANEWTLNDTGKIEPKPRHHYSRWATHQPNGHNGIIYNWLTILPTDTACLAFPMVLDILCFERKYRNTILLCTKYIFNSSITFGSQENCRDFIDSIIKCI